MPILCETFVRRNIDLNEVLGPGIYNLYERTTLVVKNFVNNFFNERVAPDRNGSAENQIISGYAPVSNHSVTNAAR